MISVMHGDCREIMPTLEAESFDAIVTDPPAGISFMGKNWDGDKGGRDRWIGWMQSVASECIRVAKPGAHALVWALPRTSHWTATAWENSGWEVRDRIAHLFGTGFPKSLNVSYAIDDHFFHEWLRAHPEHAVRLNGLNGEARKEVETELRRVAGLERNVVGINPNARASVTSYKNDGRAIANALSGAALTAPATPEAAQWTGWGTALKPACEDWWLLRKPLSERTIAANVLAHGTGALNIDATRVPAEGGSPSIQRRAAGAPTSCRPGEYGHRIVNRSTPERYEEQRPGEALGRWPANLVHNGSPEVLAAFAAFGETRARGNKTTTKRQQSDGVWASNGSSYGVGPDGPVDPGDAGSPARFFFSAKANAEDRLGSRHPTIKPTDLVCWLLRLVVPPGGHVLDPFAGSGSTGMAAMREGFDATLIEMEEESVKDIHNRLAHVHGHDTPLFADKEEPASPLLDLFDGAA